MIQAAIFDMDGTLIDSEPLWKEAEKQVFSSVGVDVTEELAMQTATMTTSEVTAFWHARHSWQGKSLKQIESEVIERVETLISSNGKAMEGVNQVLAFLQARNVKIGLATNAPAKLIPVVLNKLGISHCFNACSSSQYETEGKPNPAVYLTTAEKLDVLPQHCIAFEDSITGLVAATRAKMKTVAVPFGADFDDPRFDLADIKVSKLSDFTTIHWETLFRR